MTQPTASYATRGGARINIVAADTAVVTYTATCHGCDCEQECRSGDAWHGTHGDSASEIQLAAARAWAQDHADNCRAMPTA